MDTQHPSAGSAYGGAPAIAKKVTVPDVVAMKRDSKRITMMTAYDAAFARLVEQAGGFKTQAKSARAARRLIDDAVALEDAGAFSIVLESIPAPVAAMVTERLSIPTIGIGAGIDCDGQVLVLHDVLGLYGDFKPKFAKRYGEIGTAVVDALRAFDSDVRDGRFPDAEHSFTMKDSELAALRQNATRPKAV